MRFLFVQYLNDPVKLTRYYINGKRVNPRTFYKTLQDKQTMCRWYGVQNQTAHTETRNSKVYHYTCID